jgi:uncharacterized membrane protein
MDLHVIPEWAPNVHPMLIHFPIVLVVLAAAVDAVHLVRPGQAMGRLAVALWVLGALTAVAAYFTGRAAAETVFIPGMAHVLVDDHRAWALASTVALAGVAVLRLGSSVARRADTLTMRILFVALALALVVLVQQTAERGARLVFEQGVGVIGGP